MSETKPFPIATPVQFSPALLESLDGSTESSLSRAQHRTQAIARQVGTKLDSLLKSKAEALDKTIEQNLIRCDDGSKFQGSPEIGAKLDSIYKTLQQSAEAKIAKPDALVDAEKSVTNCLLKNQGRPLNCWDEVQAFKKIAGNP